MTTTKLELAARQALECAERCESIDGMYSWADTITALQEALAEQAEQKPVAFIGQGLKPIVPENLEKLRKHEPGTATLYDTPLYAAPVRTKDHCNPLQDLTDDEIGKAIGTTMPILRELQDARAVIAADRAKNNLCERTK